MRLTRTALLLLVFGVCTGLSVAVDLEARKQTTSAAQKQKPKPKPSVPAKPDPPKPAPAKEPEVPAKPSGIVIHTKYTAMDGQVSETTIASTALRQRVDLGSGTVVVTQCDLKQVLQINDKAKTWVAVPFDSASPPEAASPTPPRKGGTVEYTTTTVDTGESKEIAGLKARRFTTVVARTASPDACDKKKERTETDGWYAAVPVQIACGIAPPLQPSTSDCRDDRKSTSAGPPVEGQPLSYTTTTYGDDGKVVSSLKMETTEITLAPVDPSLLEAPASYTKAPDAKAFLAAVERAANEERWAASKAAGTIRIGVVTPSNKSGEDVSGDALAKELLDGLTAAPYEAVPLRSTTPAEQNDEARKKECDYVIYSELTSLKTTTPGKMGSVLRRASGGGSPSELHEAKFDYRVFQTGSEAPRVAKSASAKTGAFTLKRAAGLARFAGRMYFGASTGMMRAMLSQGGGMGGGVPSRGADPSLNAVTLVANLLSANDAPTDETSVEATISAALHNVSAAVIKDLSPPKGK